jgi:hypothetical protein
LSYLEARKTDREWVRVDSVVSSRIDNQISFNEGMREMKLEETKRIIFLNGLKENFKRNQEEAKAKCKLHRLKFIIHFVDLKLVFVH